MKNLKTTLLSSLFLLACFTCAGQGHNKFNNCTAAFLNDKLVVDEYTTWGKCVLNCAAQGTLTVATADLSPELSKPTGRLPFMIALRDGSTRTLTMFSAKVYKEISVAKVLDKCKIGDSIVLMTMSDEYSMPHNEILVSAGGKGCGEN